MPLPDVNITRSNGNLNRVQPTADNVFLLVLSGAAVAGKIGLLEVKSLNSSTDITGTLGITNTVTAGVGALSVITLTGLGPAGAQIHIQHGLVDFGNFSHFAADLTLDDAAIRLANQINALNNGYTAIANTDTVELTAPASTGAAANATTLVITPSGSFTAIATPFANGINSIDNSLAYQELSAFYANAKDGTKVYLMLYSAATPLATLCQFTNTTGGIRKALDQLGGEVSIVYVNKKVAAGYTPTITDGLDADVWAAAANLQTLLSNYQSINSPVVGTLPGLGFTKAGAANLASLKQRSNNMVSIVLGSDSANGLTCMGRLAGWESLLQVNQNIGRVKSGAVLELAYFIDGTPVSAITALLGDLHDKGYIFFRKILRKSGYYYNGDSTAVAESDDYSSRSWNRTINKAQRIAYEVLIMHLNDDVDTDPNTGGISPALAADWEGEVESAIKVQMISAKADVNKQPKGKEIDGVKCTIDLDSVVVANDQVKYELRIVRKGQAKNISGSIGYAATI